MSDFETILRESLPPYAADRLLEVLGSDSSSAMVSVRVNPFKTSVCDSFNDAFGEDSRPVPWCGGAFFLSGRPAFTLDPAFHAGAYYVQDSSSMFPSLIQEKICNAADGGTVLDLCASPGGKTTHLLSILKGCSKMPLLVSNEAVGKRVPPLTDNIAKWGSPNVLATNLSAEQLGTLEGFFDVILTDVPCSGEGMFRKSADAVDGWSRASVMECAALQRSILSDVWPALKPGGLLIYSTCTYNHFENQDNVKYIAEELGADFIPVENDRLSLVKGLVSLPLGYQFVPGLVDGEGQFFALLRKKAGENPHKAKPQKHSGKSRFAEIQGDFFGPVRFLFDRESSQLYLLPSEPGVCSAMMDAVMRLSALGRPFLKTAGCRVGEVKAGKIVPDADLALSSALAEAEKGRISAVLPGDGKETALEFFCAEIGRETALKFLSRENITPQPSWPRGYILLKYRGLGLGFVNNLGSRCNSLHPLMRRILHR
jgi:16S rRNA C967 or C1407 C5-methylase (RsmB/RsmF family)